MVPRDDQASIYLSAQRALLGAIGPSVLGIALDATGGEARMQVFAEGSLPQEEEDDLEDVATEVMAGFPQLPVMVSIVSGATQPLEGWSGRWVFLRRGVKVAPAG
jgi:hypothetical protein